MLSFYDQWKFTTILKHKRGAAGFRKFHVNSSRWITLNFKEPHFKFLNKFQLQKLLQCNCHLTQSYYRTDWFFLFLFISFNLRLLIRHIDVTNFSRDFILNSNVVGNWMPVSLFTFFMMFEYLCTPKLMP